MTQTPAIQIQNVSKSFGSNQVLHDISLSVPTGETRGLVGRNGAGKSTLVGVMTGLLQPSSGEVYIEGRRAPAQRSNVEWRNKVACVYQRSTLVPTLSVAENLFLNANPDAKPWVNWRNMKSAARTICEEWELDVNVDTPASALKVEQRQIVEIARALAKGSRFIIFDEPTAALEVKEIARLFERIRRLKRDGYTLLYISHHLQEIYDICDSVTVLRDGLVIVPEAPVAELPKTKIVEAMVGHELSQKRDALTQPRAGLGPVLSVRKLTLKGTFDGISFAIAPGETVGLAGLGGSGKEQIAESIAGLVRPDAGEISVDDAPLKFGSVQQSQNLGVSYVPRDRRGRALIPQLSIAENLTITIQKLFSHLGWISSRQMMNKARQLYGDLSVVASSPLQPVVELSGGNQQKVVMGRALASSPKLLVLVYPTQGVDIASKAAIFDIVAASRTQGTASLIVSDEADELKNCHRILVIFKGRIVKEFGSVWQDRELIAAIEGVET